MCLRRKDLADRESPSTFLILRLRSAGEYPPYSFAAHRAIFTTVLFRLFIDALEKYSQKIHEKSRNRGRVGQVVQLFTV